jgi:hypothetical protein
VPPVLVGPAWFDQDRLHAKPQEPHAQPRESAQTARREGRTVVAEHVARQSQSPEAGLQRAPHILELRRDHRPALQRRAAVDVVDRQRIAARPVAHDKPALVVDRPHVVRLRRRDDGRRARLPTSSLPARHDDPGALEDRVDGASRRPLLRRLVALENRQDLLRAPSRARLAHPQDLGLEARGCLVGVRARSTRAIDEADRAVCGVPPEQLVAGLTADAVLLAKLGHRPLAVLHGRHELQALVHWVCLVPRHPGSVTPCVPRRHPGVSPMCPDTGVTHVPGSDRKPAKGQFCDRVLTIPPTVAVHVLVPDDRHWSVRREPHTS